MEKRNTMAGGKSAGGVVMVSIRLRRKGGKTLAKHRERTPKHIGNTAAWQRVERAITTMAVSQKLPWNKRRVGTVPKALETKVRS